MSCHISEIEDVLKHSKQAPVTISRLTEFLEGVVDGLYSIAHHGVCNWSKGIDDYSTGMNTVSDWYNDQLSFEVHDRYADQKAEEKPVDVQNAISILNHIRYVSKNLIKDNGMKTIDELAAVGIGYLGGNPYESSN